jgi:hypothetical protein
MNPRTTATAIVTAAALLAPAAAAAYDQTAIPYQPGAPALNGCPAGWEALQVSSLTPLGYGLPAKLDATANGGNGDGTVCGQPFTPQEQAARAPGETVPVLFDFRDNSLKAFQN